MGYLLNLFYRLPLDFIIWSFLILAQFFVVLCRRYGEHRWFRVACICVLACWFWVMLCLTILNRPPGSNTTVHLMPFHYVLEILETGNKELFRSMFMNTALFFPAGLLLASLLPRSWSQRRSMYAVCSVCLGISTAVELCQYLLASGRMETDDILHNTLGAILGALITVSIIPSRSS